MDLDEILSLIAIGALVVLAAVCIASVVYVRRVNSERQEPSRYLDMLIARDTRCGLAMADLLCLTAYTTARSFLPQYMPPIGAGWVSVWIVSAILLFGWGPIADAVQFKRDRQTGTQ